MLILGSTGENNISPVLFSFLTKDLCMCVITFNFYRDENTEESGS